MRRWWAEHYLSDVSGLEGPYEVPEVADTDAYVVSVEGESNWDVSDWIDGPDLGHLASISVDYDQFQAVCSMASLLLHRLLSILFLCMCLVLRHYLIVLLFLRRLACLTHIEDQ